MEIKVSLNALVKDPTLYIWKTEMSCLFTINSIYNSESNEEYIDENFYSGFSMSETYVILSQELPRIPHSKVDNIA